MTGPGARVEVLPGDGVVMRAEGALLVVPSVTAGQRERASDLVASSRRAPDPTGRLRARAVAAVISAAEDPDEVPGFALVLEIPSGTKVLVYGDVTVTIRGPHEESFDARDSLAWLERQVDPEFTSLTVTGPQAAGASAEPVVPFDLVEGTVPAGGVAVHRSVEATTAAREAAQAPAQPAAVATPAPTEPVAVAASAATPEPAGARESAVPQPVSREPAPQSAPESAPAPLAPQPAARAASAHRAAPPAPTEPVPVAGGSRDPSRAGEFTVVRPATPFRSVPLGGPQGAPPPPRAPLPVVGADTSRADAPTVDRAVLVDGRTCPDGHFNAPEATECTRCGRPMPAEESTVRQARPPLGVLVTDDGSVFSLGSDVVIGREPAVAEEVQAGRASPLQLRDAEHSVSRVHARVTLEGWQVLLSDSGSSNGTFLSHHGQAGPWEAVPEDPPTPLTPGDRIRVGKRQLMFDRPTGAGRPAEG